MIIKIKTLLKLATSRRVVIDIELWGRKTPFLYDPSSRYSIISQQLSDLLFRKAPLTPLDQSGQGVEEHLFEKDGVTYND